MTWFERLTGFAETTYAETRSRLRVTGGRLVSDACDETYAVGRLETPALADLRARTSAPTRARHLTLGVLTGDVRALHCDPANAGALFQVASQFNLLEMPGPDVTPEHGVAGYEHDHTQGPACAIAAGAGTIFRNYFAPVGDQQGQTAARQLDMLRDLEAALADGLGQQAGTLWTMRNGYAFPHPDHLPRIEAHLAGLSETARDALRARLRIGVHWDVEVTEPGAARGTLVTQAYCAALPILYMRRAPEACAQLASLILEASYEASLRAASDNAARGGSNRVLLTRVGGGVFGNADDWINAAILRALRLMEGHDLDVSMVCFGAPEPAVLALERAFAS